MFEIVNGRTDAGQWVYFKLTYELGSQTGFFGPVFFPKSQKLLALLQVIFSFILTPMCFRYAKIFGLEVMKGFVFTSDIWVSDPKLTFFAYLRIIKLLLEYEDTHATEIFSQIITGGKIHIL